MSLKPISKYVDELRETLGLDYQQAVEVMEPFAEILPSASRWSDEQLSFFEGLAKLKREQLREAGEL